MDSEPTQHPPPEPAPVTPATSRYAAAARLLGSQQFRDREIRASLKAQLRYRRQRALVLAFAFAASVILQVTAVGFRAAATREDFECRGTWGAIVIVTTAPVLWWGWLWYWNAGILRRVRVTVENGQIPVPPGRWAPASRRPAIRVTDLTPRLGLILLAVYVQLMLTVVRLCRPEWVEHWLGSLPAVKWGSGWIDGNAASSPPGGDVKSGFSPTTGPDPAKSRSTAPSGGREE